MRISRTIRRVAAGLVGSAAALALLTSPAAATIGSNDYPSSLAMPAQDAVVDPWGFFNRECTSFVAWRLNNDNGTVFTNTMAGGRWGNAYEWWNNAAALGYQRNGTAAAGAVAYWAANYHGAGAFGHVAYVRAVNADGSLDTEDYNASTANPGTYAQHHYLAGSSAWPYGFIHVKDLPPAAWGGVGAASFVGSDTLTAGQELHPGDYLLSSDARYALVLQTDGNLVLYSGGAVWFSNTAGSGASRLVMQTDGNLVLYNVNTPVWYSGTGGTGPAHLNVQADGNLVVIHDGGSPIWQAGTGGHAGMTYAGSDSLSTGQALSQAQFLRSADRRYGLLLQPDGNVVLYGPGYHVLWNSASAGTGATRLVMQSDGNLVLYNVNIAVWNSGSGSTGPAHVVLQSDGNLVVYNDAAGAVIWQAGTGGRV